MAQVKSHRDPLLERGDIYFLYRPRVETQEAHGLKDVERFYMLLQPRDQSLYRLIVIGRKRLPDPSEHNRFWAFVWRVFTDRDALVQELGPQEYQTKTRSLRHVPPARPAAEGSYAIGRHDDHTHLAYVIELPARQGPVARELNIERKASYIIAVRNPESPRPPNTGIDPDYAARFPEYLQKKLAGRKFLPVDPPDFLNHEGAELILVGASEDPERELGIELKANCEEHAADLFRDLDLPREIARAPLFEGQWK